MRLILCFAILVVGCSHTQPRVSASRSEMPTIHARCGIRPSDWSILDTAPADASTMLSIVASVFKGTTQPNSWWFSSRDGRILLCNAPDVSRVGPWPDCGAIRWIFVRSGDSWLLAKDRNGRELSSSTICVAWGA